MPNLSTLPAWIKWLPENGRYVFSREDANAARDVSPAAVKMALYRLKRSGAIVSPRRDFFVIVPSEYRSAGSPPATWFIDDLMRHLKQRYYVALLSAAALHGAAHQQPMAFQVITGTVERSIEVGRVRIEFHQSNLIDAATTMTMQTETGSMVVATPETTAFDLVRFPEACGYWSNIATVLFELADKLEPEKLSNGAARVAHSDVQRLGWLLDFVEQHKLADALAHTLEGKYLRPVPLSKARNATTALPVSRWRVVVNDDVEPDL